VVVSCRNRIAQKEAARKGRFSKTIYRKLFWWSGGGVASALFALFGAFFAMAMFLGFGGVRLGGLRGVAACGRGLGTCLRKAHGTA